MKNRVAPLLVVRILAAMGICAGLAFTVQLVFFDSGGFSLDATTKVEILVLQIFPFWFIAIALLWKGTLRSLVFTIAFVVALVCLLLRTPNLFVGILVGGVAGTSLVYELGRTVFPLAALVFLLLFAALRNGKALLWVSGILLAVGVLCESDILVWAIRIGLGVSGQASLSFLLSHLMDIGTFLIVSAWLIQVVREAVRLGREGKTVPCA
jgi:hypothetical protein